MRYGMATEAISNEENEQARHKRASERASVSEPNRTEPKQINKQTNFYFQFACCIFTFSHTQTHSE